MSIPYGAWEKVTSTCAAQDYIAIDRTVFAFGTTHEQEKDGRGSRS